MRPASVAAAHAGERCGQRHAESAAGESREYPPRGTWQACLVTPLFLLIDEEIMVHWRLVLVGLMCICPVAAATQAPAQHATHASSNITDPGPLPKYVADPIPLYTAALGPFHRKISTRHPEAQAFFDQGFQMMYAFAKLDAVRSFREAWKRDPACAICYWGEAWAWGSYLNGPMSAEHAPFAYAAAQQALARRDQASPWEQAFIDAIQVRFAPRSA